MELDLGPEIAEFRAELRDWLAAEAPPVLPGLADWNMPVTAGGRTHAKLAEAERREGRRSLLEEGARPRRHRACGRARARCAVRQRPSPPVARWHRRRAVP
jgi:hypothetical protein